MEWSGCLLFVINYRSFLTSLLSRCESDSLVLLSSLLVWTALCWWAVLSLEGEGDTPSRGVAESPVGGSDTVLLDGSTAECDFCTVGNRLKKH